MRYQLIACTSVRKIERSHNKNWMVYDNIPLVPREDCDQWCNLLLAPVDALASSAFSVFAEYRPYTTVSVCFVEV